MLDTWFSSALWPFATLGWPDRDDPRLERYYPGHVLATARDIINLWVARMLMMGLEFMGDIPFEDVVINPTILAPDGRRMSKSLGTGIDPLELVDSYGADATRYGLLKMSSTQDVRFSAGMIEEGGEVREQALERRPVRADPGRHDGRAGARRDGARGPVDPLAAGRGAGRRGRPTSTATTSRRP